MKKAVLLVMAGVCVMAGAVPVFAASKGRAGMITLTNSVENLAQQIVQYNKPVFETQLTKKERQQDEFYGDTFPPAYLP